MSLQQLSLQQDSLQATYSKKGLGQTASTRSFGQQSLQQNSLQAAYSIGSFQTYSLTGTSLSFQDQLSASSLDELERTALETELAGLKRRHRSSSSLSRTSFRIILFSLMVTAFLSKCIFTSFRDSEIGAQNELTQNLFLGWALELAEMPVLQTTLGKDQLSIFSSLPLEELEEKNNLQSCRDRETVEPIELQNLLWDQELAKFLAHKTCPLDLLYDHLGQELLWENQLQPNTLENEKNKKLENKELDKKNFQSLIYKKLVALLLEKHFASAASSQLLGYEAWGRYREASEDSFDKVGDKELLQEELRRQELGCKDLWPAYLWALCPTSFEEHSFTEETFANTSLGKETFTKSSLTTSSFTEQLDTEQLDREQLLRKHLLKEQLLRGQL